MFNFTTQTVFNTVVKATTAEVRAKSKPGYNVIVAGEDENPEVRIGNTRFNKDNVLDIQIKNHTVENLAEVTFDVADLITLVTADETETQAGNYRIAIYLGLSMNSQDSFYANDFVYKGKPLYVEFPIGANDTAATVATRIKKIADKYMLFMAQEKILDISVDSTEVTFKGVNGYQQIKKFAVQKFDPNATQIDCCTNNGEFVDVIVGVPLTWTTDETGVVTVGEQTLDGDGLRELEDNEVGIAPGIEAFGDYNWMIHNLRLPTLANTYFWAVTKSEMPVVGGNYTQFIIRLCVERDGIAGEVVGQRATSVTTHVLYVLDSGSNVSDITTLLTALKTPLTDADDVLANPFALESNDGGNG